MRALQAVVFQAVVGWCTSEPREALFRYSWQESVLSARGLGEWRLPLGALQAGVSTALLWWACMSGAPAQGWSGGTINLCLHPPAVLVLGLEVTLHQKGGCLRFGWAWAWTTLRSQWSCSRM